MVVGKVTVAAAIYYIQSLVTALRHSFAPNWAKPFFKELAVRFMAAQGRLSMRSWKHSRLK